MTGHEWLGYWSVRGSVARDRQAIHPLPCLLYGDVTTKQHLTGNCWFRFSLVYSVFCCFNVDTYFYDGLLCFFACDFLLVVNLVAFQVQLIAWKVQGPGL